MMDSSISSIATCLQNPAFAAVYGSVVAAVIFYIREECFSKPQEKKRTQCKVAAALKVELESLYEICSRNKLPDKLVKEGNSYRTPSILPLGKSHTAVFLGNAVNIGIFKLEDGKIFVSYYCHVFGLMDTLKELSKRWGAYATANRKYLAVVKYNRMYKQSSASEEELLKERDCCLLDYENLYPTAIRYQDFVLKNYKIIIERLEQYIKGT